MDHITHPPISLGPPSEPQNVSVLEVNSSAIRVCWEEPSQNGSPYLAYYEVCYGSTCERADVSDRCSEVSLKERKLYNITVRAVSESEGVTAKSPSSKTVLFAMGEVCVYVMILKNVYFRKLKTTFHIHDIVLPQSSYRHI